MTKSDSLHTRIRNDIAARIRSGDLPPGARIPFEHDLMQIYGCARMTVNKALTALATEGLIERRKKAGSFVAVPKMSAMVLDIPDIEAQVLARGETYDFRLIGRNFVDDTLELVGVHICGGRPLCYEYRVIYLQAVPAAATMDFTHMSPGGWLLKQVPWTTAENRISALSVSGDIAQHLALPEGAACLRVDRTTWQNGQPVTFVQQIFDGANYHLVARF